MRCSPHPAWQALSMLAVSKDIPVVGRLGIGARNATFVEKLLSFGKTAEAVMLYAF